MKRVKVGDVATAVHDILENYFDGVADDTNKLVAKVAAETVIELQHNSPKDRGIYAKGWYIKQTKKAKLNNEVIIANKEYRLTHLLEHGHIKKVHGKILGFTAARPHIRQSEQNAIHKLENGIKGVAKQ